MPWVPVAVAVNAVLLVAGVAVPPLRDLLGTEPLTSGEFVVDMAAALLPATLVAAQRGLRARRRRTPGPARQTRADVLTYRHVGTSAAARGEPPALRTTGSHGPDGTGHRDLGP